MGGHEWVSHEGWIENVAKELDCKFIEAQSNVPGSNRMQLQTVGVWIHEFIGEKLVNLKNHSISVKLISKIRRYL